MLKREKLNEKIFLILANLYFNAYFINQLYKNSFDGVSFDDNLCLLLDIRNQLNNAIKIKKCNFDNKKRINEGVNVDGNQ